MKERNTCLNVLKCIACISVVFIHVTFPGVVGNIVKNIALFAVPTFFMIAGYYYHGCDYKKIKSRFFKIVKILIFGIIVFFVYQLMCCILNGNVTEWLASLFSLEKLFYFFGFCTIGWAIPLWYLIAMAETYLVWIFVVKKNLQEKFVLTTVPLFAIGTALSLYVESTGVDWSYKINFVCRALLWFMLGYLVKSKYESKLNSVNNITFICLAVVGSLITVSDIFIDVTVKYAYIGVLLTAPSLFLLAIKNPKVKFGNAIDYIGDKLSLFIYILHVPIFNVLTIVCEHFGLNIKALGVISYIYPIMILIVAVVVAIVVEHIFRNKHMKKLLY